LYEKNLSNKNLLSPSYKEKIPLLFLTFKSQFLWKGFSILYNPEAILHIFAEKISPSHFIWKIRKWKEWSPT